MNNLNDIFFAPAANQDLTYEQILEDVQRYFAENHAATIAEAGDGNTDRASSLLKELMVQYIVKRKYAIEGLTTEELCEKLYINEPVKANFEAFVYEAELINANTTSAINSLKMKIPNRVFHEWANILIQCQSDRAMKNTLPTIAQKFSDVRVVQSELEAMMQGPRREAITMMFLVIANVPLLYFLNEDWFHTLLFTTPGKIALAICAAIILFALTQIMKLSRPIEYGGDSA